MVAGTHGSYIISNATLLTLQPLAADKSARARIQDSDLGIVRLGSLVVEDGTIVAAGSASDCKTAARAVQRRHPELPEYNVDGAVVMPGLIDAHTHALFAGERIADFEDLAAGRPPALGMGYTIAQTRQCDETALLDIGARHLTAMRDHGTTTAEVKSGYALTTEGEARLLAALATLDRHADLPHVIPTFCGAHALPPEFTSYDAFVEELCTTMLPQVVAQGIARFADAFCEQGFFSPLQSTRFLRACAGRGLGLRIHANELHASGGALAAAQLRTASADHLNFIDEHDIKALALAGCVAVLCPGTVDYLGLERYAPARDLIDAGVAIALATDFNPGTCPSFSLQMVAFLARRHMQLSISEVIAALTINAAHSLSLATQAGSLTPGKRGDAIVLAIDDYREFGYFFGCNIVKRTLLGAKRAS